MSVSFGEAIALTPGGEGRFIASTPTSWMASKRAPGGLVEAQMFEAVKTVVGDPAFKPVAFSAHLLRAPALEEYEIYAELLRMGRTLGHFAVKITQKGKLIATALASFGTPRLSPDLDEMPMPRVDPPTPGRETSSYIPEFAFPYGNNVVLQDRLGPPVFQAASGPMERIGWAGFKIPREVDAAGLLMMGDVGMMGLWVRLDRMHTTATLDHTTHFRADLDNFRDDFVLLRSRTGLVRNGYLDWDIDVWAADGVLLCQSRQLLALLT